MAQSKFTEAERYWQKVDRRGVDDCWEWTAYRNSSGYGCFRAAGRPVLAHRYSAGTSVPRLAKEFGVHKSTIDAMAKGRSWMHLGLAWETRPGRLNPDRVRDIRTRFAAGECRHSIAADYRIRPKTVNEVVARRNWASVA